MRVARFASIFCLAVLVLIAALGAIAQHPPTDAFTNLVTNGDFETRDADGKPTGYRLDDSVGYRFLGDKRYDFSSWGVALQSANHPGGSQPAGEVSTVIDGIDSSAGRWFRFSFRGLPQDHFAVTADDLAMKVAFFSDGGKTSYDVKEKSIYPQVEKARKDMTVNGVRRRNGAEVWQTYQLDFWLPFPQVTQLRLSVGFGHGAANSTTDSEFFLDDFRLVRIPEPADAPKPGSAQAVEMTSPPGKLIPIGGRWSYWAKGDETEAPKKFDASNAERLLYHDAVYSAPFAGNMTAVMHAGELDLAGNSIASDRVLQDNVTVSFDATSMIIHSHGIPNHPTARFPADRESGNGNPNSIQEQDETFYVPLDPRVNLKHIVTTRDNSNHALPMGPIGIAVNGVVFFNPFDMGNRDASDLMDRCCGHPNQDNQYHYHKYPICLNSPWADDGKAHSPLIGWAFDGFPIYGPYESRDLMAKDAGGEHAINAFNMHFDPERGWHYHVTPGVFPYLIGGYWGTEDARDKHGPPGRGGPGGRGGSGGNGPGGFGPPPGGFGPPPDQQ